MVLPDDDSLKPAFYQGLVEGFQVCGLLLDEILQFVDAGNLCVPGSSVNRAFFSLFPELEDLVGNLVVAPKSKADMAFIMHSLSWLASNGTAAIVCFPGIMYRGGAEQKIRKYLIDNNYVDCIIQLPSNLFFGTSIATCIMVMKKNKVDNKILFIDATL